MLVVKREEYIADDGSCRNGPARRESGAFDSRAGGSPTLPSTSSSTPYTLAMATLGVAKKYTTLAPTVRTLASGVPAASGISFRHASSGDHGHDGARHSAPSPFAIRFSAGSKKSFVTRMY